MFMYGSFKGFFSGSVKDFCKISWRGSLRVVAGV